ncbi:MAG: bifunctional pyr operon transcriptional regulator/uracil phosphoribosyltransferase PyrR [Yaniella sp.]|nr:bifunctional pyr operon transcriptional regulator/uracil phosphoribosyltransferase PyrR [Yaniella sp.]MDN5816445.1 bifunctional pyr operon transcriptional regulator/uracil phosphoribosyltransferase PyrR [Yaniella sp.]MDN5817084.1 bifunctional pyr operon transcriptional regulator/uracil phosphoribosyltransferase PyrR [Yaniella sp.]MDN5837554.1 bifunctional pyr operon transcriptional regulator/uracil phosphoribosyltransferase PyrR [Yaniella sp.]MDN5889042.1 bifunctional pyr operon transcriptio
MSESDIHRVLTRIAHEILEANRGVEHLMLLGIPRRGVPLANRLAEKLAEIEPEYVVLERTGQLDITLYRDDLARAESRIPATTIIPPAGIDNAVVVLVDDVLYSGRTIRAALDALADIGRPRTVRLAVLVDRGHRQLPLRADYVGKNLPTASSERVMVQLAEIDGGDDDYTSDQVQIVDVMH